MKVSISIELDELHGLSVELDDEQIAKMEDSELKNVLETTLDRLSQAVVGQINKEIIKEFKENNDVDLGEVEYEP